MKGQRRNNFFQSGLGIGNIYIIPFVFLGGMLEFSSGGSALGVASARKGGQASARKEANLFVERKFRAFIRIPL